MKDSQADGRIKIIEGHCSDLKKYFDTVQIFCTKYDENDEGESAHFSIGDGNFFSRYGQIKLWAIRQESKEI